MGEPKRVSTSMRLLEQRRDHAQVVPPHEKLPALIKWVGFRQGQRLLKRGQQDHAQLVAADVQLLAALLQDAPGRLGEIVRGEDQVGQLLVLPAHAAPAERISDMWRIQVQM